MTGETLPFEPPGLRDLIASVSYKPGWEFRLGVFRENEEPRGWAFYVISDTEDRSSTRATAQEAAMGERLTAEERARWDVDPDKWPHTPPLHVFRALMDEDDNTWWRAGSGHGLNAYEEAVDALAAAEARADRHGPCVCNTGPGTDGPDEFCPHHGRPYSDLLAILGEDHRAHLEAVRAAEARAETLARQVAAVKALAERLETEADGICPPRHYDEADKAWRVAHVRRRVAADLRAALDTATEEATHE